MHGGVAYLSTARLLPPPLPAEHLARPRVDDLLDVAAASPLTAIVAGPGYGKSTALAAWAAERRLCWYTCSPGDARLPSLLQGLTAALRSRVPTMPPELGAAVRGAAGPDADDVDRADALAALLAEAVDSASGDTLHLILDGTDAVPADSPGGRLLASLVQQGSAALRLVLSARSALPLDITRMVRRGEATEVTGQALAFTADETAALLRLIGVADRELAEAVHGATAGWPAAVRLVAEVLRDRPATDVHAVLGRLHAPGGRLHGLLDEEVLGRDRPDRRDLVRHLALLPRVNVALCEHLGVVDAAARLAELERFGILLDHEDADGWFSLAPVVRDAVRVGFPLPEEERRDLAQQAASWLVTATRTREALQVLEEGGVDDALADFLAEHGSQLVAQGACTDVVSAASRLPDRLHSPGVRLVESHARQVLGDWQGALDGFSTVAGSEGPLSAGLAWRMGLIYHFRGELDAALETYQRGFADTDPAHRVDRAHLLGWAGTANWLRGDLEVCRRLGNEAFALARAAGDASALAIAHTTLALVAAADGDRRANEAHYVRALAAAEEAGDVLQLLRIRCNRGSRRLEEGAYGEAVAELEVGLRLAETSGFAALHGITLCNRGGARLRLGRLEEAAADYEAARARYQRIDSRMVSYALGGLGDVHRTRGDLALARAAYEEAVDVAEAAGDAQGLIPALAGLARVVVGDDPAAATELAERAVTGSGALSEVEARLAAGWVALARQNRESAEAHAKAAEAAARGRRDRAGLAESLELEALAASDPGAHAGRLDEAAAIWRQLGDPIGTARSTLAAAQLDRGGRRQDAARARRRLRELGVSTRAAEVAGTLREVEAHLASDVEIGVLGGFAVRRRGVTVPHTAWQSRKARELVKILLARRGRPTPREQLLELLWPDEDPVRTSNRLSGLLSVGRAVFDPHKQEDPDRFLTADRHTIGLDFSHITVDVEAFLETASEGLSLREHEPERARELLVEAEAAYTGDAFEEDPYEDWAIPLREEGRATYVAVARALAADAAAVGDADRTTRYLLRVLERDPYDERAHLELIRALVAGGRHGEARRSYRTYTARMDELGVSPEPFTSAAGR